MICAESYQSIPDDPRDNILSSEDYFDMFYSELCKRNGVKDFLDEEYVIIRRWWYEFENGSGNDVDSGCDKSVEDMKSELKDFDEGREKHTCETCERKRCDVFCKHCRTGCNDDYTMTDYWHSYTQVEQRLWNRIAELQNTKNRLSEKIEKLEEEKEYAKTIIRDLLINSDEYARPRAIDFLNKEVCGK